MKTTQKIAVLFVASLLLLGFSKTEEKKEIEYEHEVVVEGLSIPWGFTFLPDNSMLITEKKGVLTHFKNGKKYTVTGLPNMKPHGQGGLMDVELHPNFKKK